MRPEKSLAWIKSLAWVRSLALVKSFGDVTIRDQAAALSFAA
jgi:hypothetical protein